MVKAFMEQKEKHEGQRVTARRQADQQPTALAPCPAVSQLHSAGVETVPGRGGAGGDRGGVVGEDEDRRDYWRGWSLVRDGVTGSTQRRADGTSPARAHRPTYISNFTVASVSDTVCVRKAAVGIEGGEGSTRGGGGERTHTTRRRKKKEEASAA